MRNNVKNMTKKKKIIRRIILSLFAITVIVCTSIFAYKSYKASITPASTVYNACRQTLINSSSVTIDIYEDDDKTPTQSLDGWYRVKPIEQIMTLYIKSDSDTDVIDVQSDEICFYNRTGREKTMSLESLSDVTHMDYHLFYTLLSIHSQHEFKEIDYNSLLRNHEIGSSIAEYIHLFNLGNTLDELLISLDENSKTILNYKKKDDVISFKINAYDFASFCITESEEHFVSSTAYNNALAKLEENKEALDSFGDIDANITLVDGFLRNCSITVNDTTYDIVFRGIARDNNELSNSIRDSIDEYKSNN